MRRKYNFNLTTNLIIIIIIMSLACQNINCYAESEHYNLLFGVNKISTINIKIDIKEYKYNNTIKASKIIKKNIEPINIYNKTFTEKEKYLLAKIAMAEAENQNIQTKTLVIMSVINRVESNDFPDSILEVIFECNGDIYQYSPVMPGGRWYEVEPDESCYEALEVVLTTKYDYSGNALYFESCEEEENWHSKNLTYLYQSGDLRFYK